MEGDGIHRKAVFVWFAFSFVIHYNRSVFLWHTG